jgi:hypothetical protein
VLLIGVSGLSLVVNLSHENPSEKVGRVSAKLRGLGPQVSPDHDERTRAILFQ